MKLWLLKRISKPASLFTFLNGLRTIEVDTYIERISIKQDRAAETM